MSSCTSSPPKPASSTGWSSSGERLRRGAPGKAPRAQPARGLRIGRCEDGPVSTSLSSHAPRVSAVMRKDERVTPLELFFDLVFVLALTQCTTLVTRTPTWEGMLKCLIVLAVLWWSWAGYAWLTSVVEPEEGAVRITMFAAMAAFLV